MDPATNDCAAVVFNTFLRCIRSQIPHAIAAAAMIPSGTPTPAPIATSRFELLDLEGRLEGAVAEEEEGEEKVEDEFECVVSEELEMGSSPARPGMIYPQSITNGAMPLAQVAAPPFVDDDFSSPQQ